MTHIVNVKRLKTQTAIYYSARTLVHSEKLRQEILLRFAEKKMTLEMFLEEREPEPDDGVNKYKTS